MSKLVGQAIRYERELADAKVKAHVELTRSELKAERRLREQAVAYERRYTDGQFGQLSIVAQEHRIFHEREHELYEGAIDRASTTLKAALDALQLDMDRFREDAAKWMTIDRFEREHASLQEKTALALDTLEAKIGNEEKVTVRQSAQEELLQRIAANNRWLIGVSLTSLISLLALLAHLAHLY